jgi:hypothetical protein
MKSEAKIKPPIPLGHNITVDKCLGRHIHVRKEEGDYHLAVTYTYRPVANTYTVLYNSTFFIRLGITFSGSLRHFHVYSTQVDKHILYDYRRGKFTGLVLIKDREPCHKVNGRKTTTIVIDAGYVWRTCRCQTSETFGGVTWRFYHHNFTRGKEDILVLNFYHQIQENLQGSLKYDPHIVSETAVVFVHEMPRYPSWEIYHYPLGRPDTTEPAVFTVIPKPIFVTVPGEDILFGLLLVSYSGSIAVHMPCATLIGKPKYHPVHSAAVHIHPQIPMHHQILNCRMQLFIKVTNFRLFRAQNGNLHAVRFYYRYLV